MMSMKEFFEKALAPEWVWWVLLGIVLGGTFFHWS